MGSTIFIGIRVYLSRMCLCGWVGNIYGYISLPIYIVLRVIMYIFPVIILYPTFAFMSLRKEEIILTIVHPIEIVFIYI